MVTRARKSSEASESRGEAGEEAGKEGGTWEFNLGGTLEVPWRDTLLPASLQFPSRPIRSLQSCRA